MSKLSLQVGSKDFDINLDGEFYDFFTQDFDKMFKDKRNIEIKELLRAYVQKSYDEYQNKLEINKVFERIDEV
ncbi:MAG: hypothetical protein L3J44_09210 [Campylobacteraceae bacterium]|nr:hypothetical protein [Campylobacteraceae bacterium]